MNNTSQQRVTNAIIEADAARHVAEAGLRYVRDDDIGLTRRRCGRSFTYLDRNGARIRHADEIKRIKSLAIPPAYVDVWICPDPDGHIQATARDAKGRKQYRYHPRWQAIRSAAKFERMQAFGEALPRIRRRIAALLKLPGMPREKVLAALVQLLDLTLIRVGNDEYARLNRSYGLTTLLTKHAEVSGSTVRFEFNGKSGVPHRIKLHHAGLAAFVASCIDLPGRELFQYVDENRHRRRVSSADVNAFLQSVAGASFTAKDFRTWGASVLALGALSKRCDVESRHAKRTIVATVKDVAEKLGNTPTVCRKSYIHPRILDAYRANPATLAVVTRSAVRGLRRDETALLEFLRTVRPEAGAKADARTAAGSTPTRVVRLRERRQPGFRRNWAPDGHPSSDRMAA
jgi:DNA topoisomerase-1